MIAKSAMRVCNSQRVALRGAALPGLAGPCIHAGFSQCQHRRRVAPCETEFSAVHVAGDSISSCAFQVVRFIYADSGAYKLVRTDKKRKNFVGYVAVEQNPPAGRGADVAVVWRGTITRDEWIQVGVSSCGQK